MIKTLNHACVHNLEIEYSGRGHLWHLLNNEKIYLNKLEV